MVVRPCGMWVGLDMDRLQGVVGDLVGVLAALGGAYFFVGLVADLVQAQVSTVTGDTIGRARAIQQGLEMVLLLCIAASVGPLTGAVVRYFYGSGFSAPDVLDREPALGQERDPQDAGFDLAGEACGPALGCLCRPRQVAATRPRPGSSRCSQRSTAARFPTAGSGAAETGQGSSLMASGARFAPRPRSAPGGSHLHARSAQHSGEQGA